MILDRRSEGEGIEVRLTTEKETNPISAFQFGFDIPNPTTSPIHPITLRSLQPQSQNHYIILTITSLETIYTTTILLGNNFLTTAVITPSQYTSSTVPQVLIPVDIPGIPTSTVVGIAVGCVFGFTVLACLFWVHVLRVKQRRKSKRSRGRSKSRSTRGSSGSSNVGVSELPCAHLGFHFLGNWLFIGGWSTSSRTRTRTRSWTW